MYTIYVVFVSILVLSFITGSIVTYVEHKSKGKKLVVEHGIIFDEEIL